MGALETTRPSKPDVVTAVTGKPLADYERYVDMLAHVFANALALSRDVEFLMTLDQSVPIHEAVRDAVRDSIQWRFAFDIDRIEAEKEADRA